MDFSYLPIIVSVHLLNEAEVIGNAKLFLGVSAFSINPKSKI